MSRRDRILCAAIGLAAFALLVPGAFFAASPTRSKSIVSATRVLAGDVPYRDFWSMYAPGQFYAIAAAMRAFGRELIVPALLACAVNAASASVLFAISRKLGASARWSAAVALVLGASRFELGPELSSYPPALLLILAALWCLAERWNGAPRARELQAGLLLGFAAWFKHDVAGYFTLGCCVGALGARELGGWRAVARIGGGALAGLAPAALLVAFAAGADAWQDLIAFPGGDFRLVRAEPYPQLPEMGAFTAWLAEPASLVAARDAANAVRAWILCVAPELAFAAGAWLILKKRLALVPRERAAALTLLACLPLYWWAAHTQQNTHLTTMAVLSLLVAAVARASATVTLAWKRALAGLVLFQALGLAVEPFEEAYLLSHHLRRGVPLGLPGTAGIRVMPANREALADIALFVRANVPEGEPIHCGLWRHDAVVIGDPRFYFLADRPSATRYHELHPGITDRESVQREMLADIEAAGVRCAVLWRFGWSDERLDQILARRTAIWPDCGSRLLDDHFRASFEPVLERGEYVVVWRKDAPPPGVR